tara:strand:+ start:970 stop:1161 length:192 start_codon:yes stop_codon:yes gene_type:complete
MFTINEKNYNENDLSDKGKAVYAKLMRLGEQKADLDIVINFWTAKLQAELPKEAVDDNTITEE